MTNWPDKPLIRIIRGRSKGAEIKNVLARQAYGGGLYIEVGGGEHHFACGSTRDSIDAWEEVTPVPTAALTRLQGAFRGVDMASSLVAAVQDVTSHLPAGKPSALDQAVAKVKGIDETSLILKGFPQEADLALLLESLSSLQVSIRKRATLAEIVLLCTTWADFLSTSDGSLDHVRECVESAPNRGGFTSMVNTAGDIASDIDDGLIASQKQHLLTIAQYALAWLAELIEKEEA